MTDTSLGSEMARIWREASGMKAALAADDPLKASEHAFELCLYAHRNDHTRAGAYARRVLDSSNAPEQYREALSRAVLRADKVEMRDTVDLMITLVGHLEPWPTPEYWLETVAAIVKGAPHKAPVVEPKPEAAHWLEVLAAVAKGVCHDALFVASTGERPSVIPPAARTAARRHLQAYYDRKRFPDRPC